MKPVNHINEGRTKVREVFDRKLPTELDPECRRSQEAGRKGKGLNEMTMPESMREHLNQGPEISED